VLAADAPDVTSIAEGPSSCAVDRVVTGTDSATEDIGSAAAVTELAGGGITPTASLTKVKAPAYRQRDRSVSGILFNKCEVRFS